MYRAIYIRIIPVIIVVILSLSIVGCGKLEGEFAFKTFFDDVYRRIQGVPQFDDTMEVNWVYVFNEVHGYHNIGVVIMKKEIIWVDIEKRIENINESKRTIYGRIKDLEEGRYKIIIAKAGKIIDQKEFLIYGAAENDIHSSEIQ